MAFLRNILFLLGCAYGYCRRRIYREVLRRCPIHKRRLQRVALKFGKRVVPGIGCIECHAARTAFSKAIDKRERKFRSRQR